MPSPVVKATFPASSLAFVLCVLVHLANRNVLVERMREGWSCVISDFGSSDFRPTTTMSTSTLVANPEGFSSRAGSNAMTLRFSSPEVLAAPQRRRRAPSDIYALGMLLYQLLTGKPPFHDTQDAFLLHMVQAGQQPQFDMYADPPVPEAVQHCVMHCLSLDPTKRPSAKALVDILDMLIKEVSTIPSSPKAHKGDAGGQVPQPPAEPPESLCCPITHELMHDPVILVAR